MAKFVVIDWQRDGLLVGCGVRRGAAIAFEQIRLSPLGQSESGTVTAGQALRKAVQEMGLSKSDAIVVVGREIVEIRNLSVPNVDADELPEIIRFQAQRQMANVGETWPLDYILLPDDAGSENKAALVAAISPAHLAEIESAVIGAGLQLTEVVLRPIEIARFALQSDTNRTMKDGAALVMCLTDQQADLMLLKAGAVVQLRSTRLPSDGKLIAAAIVGEIKRSMVAAASQIEGLSLASGLLIAPAELAGKVEHLISEAVGCSFSVIDPLVMLPANYPDADQLNHSSSNRIAAMAGVLGTPNPDKRTLIDFKSPKKRPPRKQNVRSYVAAGAAVGLVLMLAGWWWYSTVSSMDRELAGYKKEIADKQGMGDLAKKQLAEFEEVKSLLEGSPNWLAELEDIALRMPPPEKVIMYNTSFSVRPVLQGKNKGTEGQIKSDVFGASAISLSDFETKLREDEKFRVNGSGLKETGRWGQYPWETNVTISVVKRGWDLLADKKPAKDAATVVTKTSAPVSNEATQSPPLQSEATQVVPDKQEPTASIAPAAEPPATKAEEPPAPVVTPPTTEVAPESVPSAEGTPVHPEPATNSPPITESGTVAPSNENPRT